ncbi:MAG: NADH-quinone oxidoreductase subunit NuoH [Lewinellaceae bacterium]|nr:NADH-quinone oxidoreductase subunit NuoH [Saprospiraceae bacterium]MCB9316514.1 NADH-quinone oxidoreductase subunit NuoH [Lewinellaceae bacterium]MCB9330498.1 NADH-quinone oxidoreductase subunit NuoH [Lewinellaceae bacterium]
MSIVLLYDISFILEKSILVLVLFAITLTVAAYATFGERKVAAFIQDRVGPNRAGPLGLLQPLADGVKFFTKEDFMPNAAERWLYILAPGAFMFVACMTSAVIPWGTELTLFGLNVQLQVTDLNVGILYILGFTSLGVYGIMIGGWSSNNKYSLYGAIRASSQMISYELAMGLSLIAVVMLTGTLSLKEMAIQQAGINWNIWYQPLGFILFFTCALAECNRAPFDMAECETELIGGYHTEYSSMKLGFFLFAEYINMFIACAVIATVYFGGYNFPGVDPGWLGGLMGPIVMFAKTFFFIFVFMWIRWTLPRFRYDQLMHLGWKALIPLSILNMLLTGAGVLLFGN